MDTAYIFTGNREDIVMEVTGWGKSKNKITNLNMVSIDR